MSDVEHRTTSERVERAAENAWLKLAGRWSMVLAATLLSIGAWIYNRDNAEIVRKLDTMNSAIAEANANTAALSVQIAVQQQKILSTDRELLELQRRTIRLENKVFP